jgi:hypothetical protein
MNDDNVITVAFSRALLAKAHALVRQHFPDMELREVLRWHHLRDRWEFHGPDSFRWDGRAGNAYHARYQGWMAWLRSKGVADA